MKKWWLYTISCVGNAVVIIILVPIIIYNLSTKTDPLDFMDGMFIVLNLIVLYIYVSCDILGLKLYGHYKNKDLISPVLTLENKILLFAFGVVHIFTAVLAYPSIIDYTFNLYSTIQEFPGYWNKVGFLLMLLFITGLVFSIGLIILYRKLRKNVDIENIGKPEYQDQV